MNNKKQRYPDSKSNRRDAGNSKEKKNSSERKKPEDFFNEHPFQEKWISKGADEEMVEYANDMGKYMAPQNKYDMQCLSRSQLRNVFGELKRIQGDFEGQLTAFYLLKPKVAYAEGRKKTCGMVLFKMIFDEAWRYVGREKKNFLNFCNLMEAILAYHKAHGGKD